MIGRGGLLALCIGAAAFAGCGHPPPSQFPTADDAFGRMKATLSCVHGVQGDAKVDYFGDKGRVRGDVDMTVVNADRIRFEVTNPFGVMLYALTSDGKKFLMIDNVEKQFLHGPASACNLARFTRVSLPPHALVSLLRGEAPLLVHTPEQTSIAWDNDEGAYRITVDSKHSARQEILLGLHPDDFEKPWQQQRIRVLNVLVTQGGIPLYQAELKNHDEIKRASPRTDPDGIDEDIQPIGGACNAEVPKSMRLEVPHTEDEVTFQYKDVLWNPPLVPQTFELNQPGGTRKLFVDCGK